MKVGYEKFYRTTGYDLKAFFTRYISFVSNDLPYIVDYYNGGDVNSASFLELDRLITETKKIEPLFDLHKSSLNTVDMWEALDLFSDTVIKLETIKNFAKWQRSSRLGAGNVNAKVSIIQNQNQTLEGISFLSGVEDSQNDWRNLAIQNQSIEEAYTTEGGALFVIPTQSVASQKIPNIVDVSSQDNVFGRDLDRNILFSDNDLLTVEGIDNIIQNLEIKLSTKKGDIPEFPSDGMDNDLIGTSMSAIRYPVLVRDLSNLFKKDGRYSEVVINNIISQEDSVFLEMRIKTILGDTFEKRLAI